MRKLRIGPSKVHGLGLFAVKKKNSCLAFETYEIIDEYNGIVRTEAEWAKMTNEESTYCAETADGLFVDAIDETSCAARYANHSNILYNSFLVMCCNDSHVVLRAARSILDGEEIMIDYGPLHPMPINKEDRCALM